MRPLDPAVRREYGEALGYMERNGWAGGDWYRERLKEDDAAVKAAFCARKPTAPGCERLREVRT